jgi:hypothetical protein
VDEKAPALVRWGVQTVLPQLVANADREELTMTALGAGTALSTLHTLGRGVLALHGHKHYATARMLEGMAEAHGDVLLVSAGSAGMAQRWHDQSTFDDARLWPSFNVIELDGDNLAIDTVSFAWKEGGSGKRARRALARARRQGSRWQLAPIGDVEIEDVGPRLALNAATCQLEVSVEHPGCWDYHCDREVHPARDVQLHRYVEVVDGLPGGYCVVNSHGARSKLPTQVDLEVGGVIQYRVLGGMFRTLAKARHTSGDTSSPFAQVALMNRYRSEVARLTVRRLGDSTADAFASATDLGTGLERPMRLERGSEPGEVFVSSRGCPARTLLRIYWRLYRDPA